jgi:hypothetical protein
MKRFPVVVVLLVIGLSLTDVVSGQRASTKPSTKSDAAIRQEMISQSLASYRGNCPCPYNTDRAGRSCGRRSAYSRPGGASPICYPGDVTDKMIDAYRAGTGAALSDTRARRK